MNNVKIKEEKIETPRVDLRSVEEVFLPDGKKYIKFLDLKENRTVMFRNNSDKSVEEQIEKLQGNLLNSDIKNVLDNTNGILDSEKKYDRDGIILVPINQIDKYQYMLNGLSQEQKRVVSIFIKNKDRFNHPILYINFEDGIALDETNRVICCWFNKDTNQYDVRYADVVKYETEEKYDLNNIDATIDDIDYDVILETLEVENSKIEVGGYYIDKDSLEQYYNYPEIFERKNLQPKEKLIWEKILNAYKLKKNMKENENNSQKIKKMEIRNQKFSNNKVSGFANNMLMASLSGFTIGLLFSIIFLLVKKFF